jgi:hypothetical protein
MQQSSRPLFFVLAMDSQRNLLPDGRASCSNFRSQQEVSEMRWLVAVLVRVWPALGNGAVSCLSYPFCP